MIADFVVVPFVSFVSFVLFVSLSLKQMADGRYQVFPSAILTKADAVRLYHNRLRCDSAVLVVFAHYLRHITQSLLAAGKLTTLDDVKLVVGGIGLEL